MSFRVYILYSPSIQRYYTGSTGDDLQERLRRHNSNHRGFTGKTDDWEVVFSKIYENKTEGLFEEKRIKKRGASRYLGDLEKG